MIFDSVEAFFEFCHWHRPEKRGVGSLLVATSGCFDILHKGQIKLLKTARCLGESVVVLLNSDDSVKEYKSPARPVKDWATRAALLDELQSVDYVVKLDAPTPTSAIMELKPQIWVKGNRHKSEIGELEACFDEACDVVVLWNCEHGSSTDLIAKAAQVYQDEQHKPAPSSGMGQDVQPCSEPHPGYGKKWAEEKERRIKDVERKLGQQGA